MEILSTSRLVAQFRSCSFIIINNVSVREIGRDAAALAGKRSLGSEVCADLITFAFTLFSFEQYSACNSQRPSIATSIVPEKQKNYMNYK